jgi:ABC-type dipeptide/oligopeptide/nickel transport system permease component|tara:strand:+ start:616 stop:1551 length:936 start_codon:yes stop_codon:yes gene_type:complete
MRRFLLGRLVFAIVSIVVATFIVLLLSRMSGDPILLYANSGYGLTKEGEEAVRKRLGLDKPIPIQYALWLGRTLKGDMGETILDRKPVSRIVFNKLPNTLQLAIGSWFLATFIGIPMGIISAVKRGTKLDYIFRTIALFGQALPQFWVGLVLILIFSVYLKWLPAGLRGESIWDLKYYILPTITLASSSLAGYLRITRSAMLEVLDSEYIRLARAKGASSNIVIWKHAFRNALIQPLTIATMLLAGFLDGAVLVETIFAWPGMGSGVLTAVNNNDFPLLQGYVFFFTVIFVFATFLSDILYAFVDPRIRYD